MIRNRPIDDRHVIDMIHGEMLTKIVKVLRQRLECHHMAARAHESRRYQRVESNVRTHVEHDVPGPDIPFENGPLFVFVATKPATVVARSDDPSSASRRSSNDR